MLGYFGFLRAAEFTVSNLASFSPAIHLSVANIFQSPTCLRVRIKVSKMDPFRQGCHIHIGLGRAALCAVHALLAYLSVRGNVPGPLFLVANGQPLSHSILTDWLQQIFSTMGIEGNFSSHSFGIGASTVAASNGIPDHLIQALGRWTSNAYQLYIHTPSEALAGISGQLAWHRVSLPLVIHSSFYIAVEFSTKLLGACTAVFGVALTVSCFRCNCCAWCLGLLESEVPFHSCSLAAPFSSTKEIPVGWKPLAGLSWIPPPHARALPGFTNFVGTNAQAHLLVMSLNYWWHAQQETN